LISILYFNVIWHKGYQNGNHIEPSERLQEISIAKNWPRAGHEPAAFGFSLDIKSCAKSIFVVLIS